MTSNALGWFRKPVRLVLAVLFVSAVAVWFVLPGRERAREPIYQGKPLSVWLEGYQLGQIHPEIDQAVRAIGSNAVPTLLRMLQAKDRPLLDKLVKLARKQSLIKVRYTPGETIRMRALAGFAALRAEAKAAVPELVKAYTNQPESGPFGPGAALAEIGPAADEVIKILLLNAQDTNSGAREIAVAALARIRGQPEVVVPALIRAARDPNPAVQYQAFRGLGDYGQEAKAAVPVLSELMTNDARLNARTHAAFALARIDGPEKVLPVFIDQLHSTNASERLGGVVDLGVLGDQAQAQSLVAPLIQKMLTDPDFRVRFAATNALASINSDTKPAKK